MRLVGILVGFSLTYLQNRSGANRFYKSLAIRLLITIHY